MLSAMAPDIQANFKQSSGVAATQPALADSISQIAEIIRKGDDVAGIPRTAWAHLFTFFVGDSPSEWVRPLPKVPERS